MTCVGAMPETHRCRATRLSASATGQMRYQQRDVPHASRGIAILNSAMKPTIGCSENLRIYAEKRDFSATPEPPPVVDRERKGPLLFVVHQHAASQLHYDLRLELDGVLKSWAVPKGPSLDPAHKRGARATEDHPLAYASFEGAIPAGQYGGGHMIVWDCGVYSPDANERYAFAERDEAQARIREELARGKISFFLLGAKLKGSFTLIRKAESKSWLWIKHRDRFVQTAWNASDHDRSVASTLRLTDRAALEAVKTLAVDQLVPTGKREVFPAKLAPMLATLTSAPFTDRDWLQEPKLDGYRMLAFAQSGRVRLNSRRGLDYTRLFPGIVNDLTRSAIADFVLDGEIIALDANARPSFNALQNRTGLTTEQEIAAAEARTPAMFYCFDLLHFAGCNLRDAPYVDRRRFLTQCLLPSAQLLSVHADVDGRALYHASLKAGFEGVVAKRKLSIYRPGRRSSDWLKVKATTSAEFLVGGYSKGKGERERLGSLVVGYRDDNAKLRYAANVGTGYTAETIDALLARVKPLIVPRSPFADPVPPRAGTTWLRPDTVSGGLIRWVDRGRTSSRARVHAHSR